MLHHQLQFTLPLTSTVTHIHIYTHHHHTHTQPFFGSGFCPGQPGWAGTWKNIHTLTLIVVINNPLSAPSIYYDPWHPLCSIYVPDSLFSTISLQVFFGQPLGLAPSTLYSIHFFTQSLSSFHSTCPYHCNLFCCSTKIMSSNPRLSLNPLLSTQLQKINETRKPKQSYRYAYPHWQCTWVNVCWITAMHCRSTKSGVDSSNLFPFWEEHTNRHIHKVMDSTDHPTHGSATNGGGPLDHKYAAAYSVVSCRRQVRNMWLSGITHCFE